MRERVCVLAFPSSVFALQLLPCSYPLGFIFSLGFDAATRSSTTCTAALAQWSKALSLGTFAAPYVCFAFFWFCSCCACSCCCCCVCFGLCFCFCCIRSTRSLISASAQLRTVSVLMRSAPKPQARVWFEASMWVWVKEWVEWECMTAGKKQNKPE